MLNQTELAGCFEIASKVHRDDRGTFVKTFHAHIFENQGLNTVWREQYWSRSAAGVVRGMHFQIPPHDHAKIVSCVHGEIMDAVLDIRTGSATFGRHIMRRLSAENGLSLYIPRGMAHGFLALSEGAVVSYALETVHDPASDRGVLWNSCGIPWPLDGAPIVSARDAALPTLAGCKSPF